MTMADESFADGNGRNYRLYTVRVLDGGFGILNRHTNSYVGTGFKTREEAWEYLRTTKV